MRFLEFRPPPTLTLPQRGREQKNSPEGTKNSPQRGEETKKRPICPRSQYKMVFHCQFSFYNGPIDLLLYLVRKHELDIVNIPIALILEQYLDYLAVLELIDVNAAGEFLALACTLIEIKLFEVLPGEEAVEEEFEDPRQELVEQLLEYKKFCDAASQLEERSRTWQLRIPRLANDLPSRSRNLGEERIREVELWDLVNAFSRIIRDHAPKKSLVMADDETPISTHMNRIHERLKVEERIAFRRLFTPGQHKSTMIGIFQATLELVRHEYAYVYQDILFGEIELAIRESSKPLDFVALDTAQI